MKDYFVSYNRQDRDWAEWISWQLEEAGFSVVIQAWDFLPGENFILNMHRAAQEARRTIAVLSEAYLASLYTQPEWAAAFAKDPTSAGRVLLPIRVRECEPAGMLAPIVYVDLVGLEMSEEAKARLLAAAQGDRNKPTVSPTFPGKPRPAPAFPAVAPRPRYRDAFTRNVSEQAEQLRKKARELRLANASQEAIVAIEQELLELKRQLRVGPRLKAGDCLLNRYLLINELGSGGFAIVWRAFDEKRKQRVAVKVLHGQFSDSAERRERFCRGARAMQRLEHPNIVRVLDLDQEDDGHHFFVMEYLVGGTFAQAVTGGSLTMEQRFRVILDIGDALVFAHERDIWHRDVTPDNILLDGVDDPAQLTDFDLVWLADTTGGTRTGSALGKYIYAAPETMESANDVDARCDVYSLGMTAVFSFHGKKLTSSALYDRGPFFKFLECPPGIKEVLTRATEFERHKRFGSMREFCSALRQALTKPLADSAVKDSPADEDRGDPGYQVIGGTGGLVVKDSPDEDMGDHFAAITKEEQGRSAVELPPGEATSNHLPSRNISSKLSELQEILHAADPAAVLVSPRVLARVIQEVCHLRGLLWNVPHNRCYVVDRQILFRHVEQEELELEPNQSLPETVILLVRPSDDELRPRATDELRLRYWRLLFHAKVHLRLQQRYAEGRLSQAQLRYRLESLGVVEVQEIRTVLQEENLLLADDNDRALHAEFAAVFLELYFFGPRLLHSFFPGLRDLEQVRQLLTQDVDGLALYQQSRLMGAPDPSKFYPQDVDRTLNQQFRLQGTPDPSKFQKRVQSSERDAQRDNLVRAAIERRRAARVAPTSQAFDTRKEAVKYLEQLLDHLQNGLQLTNEEKAEWLKDLSILLDRADQGRAPVEAALLFDLQKIWLEFDRELFALDIVEWIMSAGRRPIKRPLPSQKLVRIMKQLRVAAQRLTEARLAEDDRWHLSNLLQAALHKCEERLRTSFRPVLSIALQDVGLRSRNPLEQTAFHKVIEEILDRITANGYLTFSDLRDTISRNQLKLPDISSPQEFVRGDPLLRLDRRLTTPLDGVYRPSELYLRWLERLTALAFGTVAGRFLTQYVVVPLGGAFAFLEILNVVIGLLHLRGVPSISPLSYYSEVETPPTHLPTARIPPVHVSPAEMPTWVPWVYYPALGLLTVFLFLLWHRAGFRRQVLVVLRRLFIDVPVSVVQVPALRWFVSSWAFQLFSWYLFKPLVVVAILWLLLPNNTTRNFILGGVFVVVLILVNSRIGQALNEAFNQPFLRLLQLPRAGWLIGLVRLVQQVFKSVIEIVECLLFSVDEFLRFRAGDTKKSMVVRAVLGVIWFPISYLARFCLLVLIEPGFNPIKLPISLVAAKVLLVPLLALGVSLEAQLLPLSGSPLYYPLVGLVGLTLFLLPDAVGFIVWETKENWNLYRATRPRTIRAVAVGTHGETIPRLLHPGFHSGTVPKYYSRLRQAERDGLNSGDWSAARSWQHRLKDVEEAVWRFVARELAYLMNQSTSWHTRQLSVGRVTLACNRILVELLVTGAPERPCWLQFEDAQGWLVANIAEAGFLKQLTGTQARAFNTGLAGLYKLAGVDLVREQLTAHLPPIVADYDIDAEGLILWQDCKYGKALHCDLHRHKGLLTPPEETPRPGEKDATVLDVRNLLFADVPLSWQQFLESWDRDQQGLGQPPLVCEGQELLLLGSVTPPVV